MLPPMAAYTPVCDRFATFLEYESASRAGAGVLRHSVRSTPLTKDGQMKCPVCGNHADPLPTTFDGEGYRCATCGEYGISRSVLGPEGGWEKLDRGGRLRALARAKSEAKPGDLPKITSYSL